VDFQTYQTLVKTLKFGKQLPDAVYVHVSALTALPAELQHLLTTTLKTLQLQNISYDVLKLSKRDYKLSLLSYPQFFEAAFPALQQSCTVDLTQGKYRMASYANSDNPPILHRKETFLLPEHPAVPAFREFTEALEQAGLLANARTIGFQQQWQRLLKRKGYEVAEGQLQKIVTTSTIEEPDALPIPIERHRTAIRRQALSVPMQTLARHGYLEGKYSVFDYGCGQGDDVRELQAHGIVAAGWDPKHAAEASIQSADIVNLGFVLNVIETPQERAATLKKAYQLAGKLLVVAVMLGTDSVVRKFKPYGDGVLTQRNTFQKYYAQSELRHYLEQILETTAIAVAPGVFYIFRDDLDEQVFLATRQRVRRQWQQLTQPPSNPLSSQAKVDLVSQHRALVEDFWQTCLDLGRCPARGEFEFIEAIRGLFGSVSKALSFVVTYYGNTLFEQAQQARREDVLVYFALNQFSRRKAYTHLPDSLKQDVKALFQAYKAAQRLATELLFSVGQPAVIQAACEETAAQGIGYLEGDKALTLHTSQLAKLPAALRVYVGCATQLYGDVETADLVKIHIHSGKVTLLLYTGFADKPLPELQTRIKIKLRTQEIDFFEYAGEYEPQPLFLKSRYVPADFVNYTKQVKFDEKLQKTGLFDFSGYGPKHSLFYETLSAHRYAVRGFQLITRN